MYGNDGHNLHENVELVMSYEKGAYACSNPHISEFVSDETPSPVFIGRNGVIQFEALTGEELLERKKPMEWVIDGLFPRGTLTSLYGKAKTMKTYAMLHAAGSISAGISWLDFDVEQGNVLYIDEESSESYMAGRYEEISKGLGYKNIPGMFIAIRNRINLTDPVWVNEIIDFIKRNAIVFVVFDALIDISGGVDENSSNDMQLILCNLGEIAAHTDAAVVCIHHANRRGDYRGSNVIESHSDQLVKLAFNKKENQLKFSVEVVRFSDNQAFTATPEFGEGLFKLTSSNSPEQFLSNKLRPSQSEIIKHLVETRPKYQKEIASYFDDKELFTGRTIEREIGKLKEKGLLERINEGGQGKAAIIDLTDKGIEYAQEMGWMVNEDE